MSDPLLDSNSASRANFIVAQIGALNAYLPPATLCQFDMLARLFTGPCSTSGLGRLSRLIPNRLRPDLVKRIAERVPVGIPASRISTNTSFGIRFSLGLRRATSATSHLRVMNWASHAFGRWVSSQRWGAANGVYLFDTFGPDITRRAKSEGLFVCLERSIAPRETLSQLLSEEIALHPGWESVDQIPADLEQEACELQWQSWNDADLVLCPSQFVIDSIASIGGPVAQCAYVPYGRPLPSSIPLRTHHGGPLRVLTVGTVGLRKGSPYVLQAASQLAGVAQFRMIGSYNVISDSARRALASSLELVGRVRISEIASHLAWADVFLLPSLCEGSAGAVSEALASGLPVVTTPNTGSAVRDGVDGFVVPIRDVQAIADRIHRLQDPALRDRMGAAAAQSAQQFTPDSCAKSLINTVSKRYADFAARSAT